MSTHGEEPDPTGDFSSASDQTGVLIVDASGLIRHANATAARLIQGAGETLVGQVFGLPLGDDLRQNIEVVDRHGTIRSAEMRVAPYIAVSSFTGPGAWAVTVRLVSPRDNSAPFELTSASEPESAATTPAPPSRMDDALSLTYHELGNAVAGLSAGLTMLRESWSSTSEEDQLVRVTRLERSASGLGIHMKGYLDADRAEAGVFQPRPSRHDLLDLILERLPDLGLSAGLVELDVIPGVTVMIDAAHCWSIIGNFITNGLKHGEGPIRITAQSRDGQTTIRVSDRGSGVSADRVPFLFQRFTHGGEAASNGLGLWIAATLARAYGGKVWWEANEPTGSTFCCLLPAAAARSEPALPSEAP